MVKACTELIFHSRLPLQNAVNIGTDRRKQINGVIER